MYMISVKMIRTIWVSMLLVTISFLLWKFIAPFGIIRYSSDFSKYHYFISELTPKDRLVTNNQQVRNLIKAEPVYFYLKTLRPFKTAVVTVNFSNPPSFMELGICRDKAQWNFERQPLYFETLEKFGTSDHVLREDGLLLWQKEKKYNSINDFISNPPAVESIGVYNYNLPLRFEIKDYKASTSAQNFALGAKGSYSMVTYSQGDPINLDFVVRKKSDKTAESKIFVTAYNSDGSSIETKNYDWTIPLYLTDYQYKTLNFKFEVPFAGSYRIEFKTDNEVETERIETKQNLLSVMNTIQLADFSRTNFSIFTDATNLSLQTTNPKSIQNIRVDEQTIDLPKTYTLINERLDDQTRKIKEIKLQKDDILLAGDGFFALKPSEIINPFPRQFTNSIDLESSGLEYVIARYEPIGLLENGQRTITFNLEQACVDKDGYPFIISMPGYSEQDGTKIENIDITFTGKNITEILKTIWNRL